MDITVVIDFYRGRRIKSAGAMLFSSLDGALIKLNTSILRGTPFDNFLIPGIILFLFIGIFPILVSYGLLRKPAWHWAEAIKYMQNTAGRGQPPGQRV